MSLRDKVRRLREGRDDDDEPRDPQADGDDDQDDDDDGVEWEEGEDELEGASVGRLPGELDLWAVAWEWSWEIRRGPEPGVLVERANLERHRVQRLARRRKERLDPQTVAEEVAAAQLVRLSGQGGG